MLDDIVELIWEWIFFIIVGFVCFNTGETFLFLLTAGRRKPRRDYFEDKELSKFDVITETSVLIGFFFWIFVIVWAL